MTASTQDRPGAIDARPVRHPGRWVAVVIIAIVVAMIISSFVTNEKWNFPFAFEIMQQTPVIEGLWKGTIFGTVGAMILGIGLGVILAVMRLSHQPGAARGRVRLHLVLPGHPALRAAGAARHRHRLPVPRLRHRRAVRPADRDRARPRHEHHVLLARLQRHLEHHLGRHPRPGPVRGRLHGRDRPGRHPVGRQGPGRGGPGARHAAAARRCGASCSPRPCASSCPRPATRRSPWSRTPRCSRRCPSSSSCSTRLPVRPRSFQIMPGIVAATLWYLIVCSILMVGQARLESYYGRGFGARCRRRRQQKLTEIGADH